MLSLFLLLIFKADYLQWRVKIQVKQTKARKFLPLTCLHVSVYVWLCMCVCGRHVVDAVVISDTAAVWEEAEKRKIVNNFRCKMRNM